MPMSTPFFPLDSGVRLWHTHLAGASRTAPVARSVPTVGTNAAAPAQVYHTRSTVSTRKFGTVLATARSMPTPGTRLATA